MACLFWASQVAQMIKNLPAMQETEFSPWVRKIPWRRDWQPTPVFLPGESQGQRSLLVYSPWGRKESDMTERLTFSLSHPQFHSHHSQRSFVAALASKRKKSKLSWGPAWRHHTITSPNAVSQEPQSPSSPRSQGRGLTALPLCGRSSREFVAHIIPAQHRSEVCTRYWSNVGTRCLPGDTWDFRKRRWSHLGGGNGCENNLYTMNSSTSASSVTENVELRQSFKKSYKWACFQNRNRLTDIREQTYGYYRVAGGMDEGLYWESGIDMYVHTAIFNIDILRISLPVTPWTLVCRYPLSDHGRSSSS